MSLGVGLVNFQHQGPQLILSFCEFLISHFEEKKLAVDTIRCYRSTLHSVLRHTGIIINRNDDIKEVIRFLKLRAPVKNPRIVHWNLDVVLKFLVSDKFEPLHQASLSNLEAAQWRCHSVFASHYLKDVELTYEDCLTLGPLLVAGTVIT